MFSRTPMMLRPAGHAPATRPPRRPHGAGAGFTLVELMLVIVIMGVLLAVAFPSYLDSVRKGRRAEGIAGLTTIQQAQERFRANSPTYGNLDPASPSLLPNVSGTTANGRYALAVTGNTPTGYTVTATAQGAQAADTPCAVMGVQATGGNLRYGSAAAPAAIDWGPNDPDAGRCWAK